MRKTLVALVVGVPAVALAAHAILVLAGGGCPIRPPTSTELEAQRVQAMAPLATKTPSPTRAVADHVLGSTTRAAFVTTETARGGSCAEELGANVVRCTGTGEVVARFDPAARLVGLDRVRYGLTPASPELGLAFEDARSRFGEPAQRWGELSESHLASPLRQAGASWRSSDVAVDVTATHLGRDGIVLREQHRAIAGHGS